MSDLGTTGSPNPTARPDEGAGAEAVTLSSLQAENASTSGQWSSGAAGNAGMPRAEAFVEDGVAQDDDEGDDVVSIASSMGEPSAAGASILVTNGHGDHGFGSHDRFEEHTSGFHDDLTFSLGTALPGTGPEQAQAYEEGALSQQIQQIESAVASLALHSQRGGGSQESAAGVHHTPQPTPDELAAPAAEQAGPSAAQEAASKSPEPHAAPQTKAAFGSAFSSPVAEPSSTGPGSSSSEIVVERSTASDATAAPRGAGAASTSSSAADTDDTCEAWHKHHKHFFILSTSGKPIYSYHGDEASLAGLMALITALISVVADQGDAVRSIQCGSTLVVFMLRGPLVLVAASQLGETEAVLRRQLSLMYGQVVLVVTTTLEKIMLRNPSYDVRSLLEGVGTILNCLARQMASDPAYLMAALRPLPMPAADRSLATAALADALKACGALYGLLMCNDSVIALERAKQQPPLHPQDLLLLANFIGCNPGYRDGPGEAFCPVCLPHFNASAFMHAYIVYLDPAAGVYLVLLSGGSDSFHAMAAARSGLEQQLHGVGVLPRLKQMGGSGLLSSVIAVDNLPHPMGGRFGSTPLWHYAIKYLHRHQVVICPPGQAHEGTDGRRRLASQYSRMHSLLHQQDHAAPAAAVAGAGGAGGSGAEAGSPGAGVQAATAGMISRTHRLAWCTDSRCSLLALADRELELYLVLDPLTDRATALAVAEGLRVHFTDKPIAADLLLPL